MDETEASAGIGDVKRRHGGGVFTVVFVYAFFAALWILLSDRAMGLLIGDPEALVRTSMAKGWFFVAVTSLLLYGLVRRLVGQLETAHRRELDYQRAQKQAPPMLVAIADASDDVIFAKDEEGRYLLLNNAGARVAGKAAAALLGKDDRALFPPAQAERLMAVTRRVLETGRTETLEEALATAQGTRDFLCVIGPLRGADGTIFGTYGIARDITQRKAVEAALRERERRLGAIVGNSPGALSLKHPDGRYALANPNVQRIHHLSEAQIVGKTDFDLYPEATARCFRDNDRRVFESLARHAIEEIVPVDGVPRTYLSHLFPVLDDDGKAQFVCRISLDITERKAADEKVLRRSAELERLNRAAIDRELRIVALKREVNQWARDAGRPEPYDVSFADPPGGAAGTP